MLERKEVGEDRLAVGVVEETDGPEHGHDPPAVYALSRLCLLRVRHCRRWNLRVRMGKAKSTIAARAGAAAAKSEPDANPERFDPIKQRWFQEC